MIEKNNSTPLDAELDRIDKMITPEASLEEIQNLKSNLSKLEEQISSSGVFTIKNQAAVGSARDEALKIQLIKRMKMLNSSICRILGTPDEEVYGTFFN